MRCITFVTFLSDRTSVGWVLSSCACGVSLSRVASGRPPTLPLDDSFARASERAALGAQRTQLAQAKEFVVAFVRRLVIGDGGGRTTAALKAKPTNWLDAQLVTAAACPTCAICSCRRSQRSKPTLVNQMWQRSPLPVSGCTCIPSRNPITRPLRWSHFEPVA